jgi:hypothetical protein
MFEMTDINGLLINAAGLVALAELTTIAERTEIIGSASRLDTLVLAPGIHLTTSNSNGDQRQPTSDSGFDNRICFSS